MPSKTSRNVWFIQNTSSESPGILVTFLKRWKISYQVCDLQKGDILPEIKKGDAVVVLGGPMSANDQTQTMLKLLKWIRKQLKNKTPYLGICLGLQTLVKAAGGKVIRNPIKEVGLLNESHAPYTCEIARGAKQDSLLKKVPRKFSIFQLHGETVKLKKGMRLLAFGDGCQNQVVKVQKAAYGLQGHLEMTRPLLTSWLKEDSDLKKLDQKLLWQEWTKHEDQLFKNCETIFFNFLKISKIIR